MSLSKSREEVEEKIQELMDEMRSIKITEQIEAIALDHLDKHVKKHKIDYQEENSWYGIFLKDIKAEPSLRKTICELNPMISTYYNNMYVLFYIGKYGVERIVKTTRFVGTTIGQENIHPLYQQKGEFSELELENFYPHHFFDMFSKITISRSGPILYKDDIDCIYLDYEGYNQNRTQKIDVRLMRHFQKGLTLQTWEAVENEQNWDYIQT